MRLLEDRESEAHYRKRDSGPQDKIGQRGWQSEYVSGVADSSEAASVVSNVFVGEALPSGRSLRLRRG